MVDLIEAIEGHSTEDVLQVLIGRATYKREEARIRGLEAKTAREVATFNRHETYFTKLLPILETALSETQKAKQAQKAKCKQRG